jgi:hypothetical protein
VLTEKGWHVIGLEPNKDGGGQTELL